MPWEVGSTWGKWDLHVHTPESFAHGYAGEHEEAWERFLSDLESLPPEFRVLGINDYIFLDGYRRVLAAKAQGRLANIATLLPVIELRVDKFGGTDGHLSRVNFHVIFSETLQIDVIQQHFINALTNQYQLAPQYQGKVEWHALPTKESLVDLGRKIKQTVPQDQLSKFGDDLTEGFNGFNVPLSKILEILERPNFKNKTLSAVGKTEWSGIRWNDQSIAEKKHSINAANIVFIAAESPEHWRTSRDGLASANVNARLFDCSDAHYLSATNLKDRIGNCFTWVNAVPTFAGLRRAVFEYDDRVFVGDEPPLLRRVRQNPTKSVKELDIFRSRTGDPREHWFDTSLPINPGFVAIIGNKGQGKSALADILGLAGDSSRGEHFSFLNRARFQNPKSNKARHFAAKVTWASGTTDERGLDARPEAGAAERVQYIPQHFLEHVCNEVPGDTGDQFTAELGRVIFSHVPAEERLARSSIETLIQVRSQALQQRIVGLRNQLSLANSTIVDLEEQLRPEARVALRTALQQRRQELAALDGARPVEVPVPQADAQQRATLAAITTSLTQSRVKRQALNAEIAAARERAGMHALREAAAIQIKERVSNLERVFEGFVADSASDFEMLGLSVGDVVRLNADLARVDEAMVAAVAAKKAEQDKYNDAVLGNLVDEVRKVEAEIERLELELDAPNRAYQAYLRESEDWSERRAALVGGEEDAGSITGLEETLKRLDGVPAALSGARANRLGLSMEIHRELIKSADVLRDIYRPVEEFLRTNPVVRDRLEMNFEVSLAASAFEDRFFEMISNSKAGTFLGRDAGGRALDEILGPVDFNTEESMRSFLDALSAALIQDKRSVKRDLVFVADQLTKGHSPLEFYDYIFGLSYLSPRYVLQSRGKPLDQLSPGEKGTILLLFYLVVDQTDCPLIIDQPEENLDNETIYTLLVKSIKMAKARRQIILVTHNPNLAVVGDADQFIHARLLDQRFEYQSGPLEDLETNRGVVNVLEGTWDAFGNRGGKYEHL